MSVITNHSFLTGLQCHKAFWIDTHKKYHPEPTLVETIYKEEFQSLVMLYQQLLAGKTTQTFTEYRHDSITISVDLVLQDDNGLTLYAINPVLSPKWSQLKLLSLWYFVLTALGLVVHDAVCVTINRDYVFDDQLDVRALFNETSVFDSVLEQQRLIEAELSTLLHVYSRPSYPQIDIGEQCNKPHACTHQTTCFANIPTPSIFDLFGMSQKEKFKWYRKGVTTFSELPSDFPFTAPQNIQIATNKTGHDFVNAEALKAFLNTITFPVYFIDFEAAQFVVPPFKGLKPFQSMPFQYSIHYMMSETDRIHHSGFISPIGEDPRYPLAKALSTFLSDPKGTLIAFNSELERQTFGQLAMLYPEFREQFLSLQSRIVDLAIPFNKMHYYSNQMGGKRSIKSLFHAKVGTGPYNNLHVMNGETASKVYSRLHTITDPRQQTAILADLMRYCHMDTLAMVRLWQEIILAIS